MLSLPLKVNWLRWRISHSPLHPRDLPTPSMYPHKDSSRQTVFSLPFCQGQTLPVPFLTCVFWTIGTIRSDIRVTSQPLPGILIKEAGALAQFSAAHHSAPEGPHGSHTAPRGSPPGRGSSLQGESWGACWSVRAKEAWMASWSPWQPGELSSCLRPQTVFEFI